MTFLCTIPDESYEVVSAEMYVILRNIQDHLEQGKVDGIMPLFAERELHSDFTNDIPTLNIIT
jgi:tyrosine-protein phosphatase YwqE